MSDTPWPTTKRAGIPCGVCGKIGSCNVSPDGTAFKCWKDGGKIRQMNSPGKAHTNGKKNMNGTDTYIGATRAPKPAAAGKAFTTAEAAIESAGRGIKGGKLVKVWTYTDATGAEVMRVARFDLPDGSKEFRPVHRVKAGWKIGDPPGPLPLYRLTDIPPAGMVWVCEGEKATDAAADVLGLAAVTSAHGSSAAEKSDWTPLAGRDVCILPDNDDAGRKYARAVAMILAKLETPARVKVLALPDLPAGGDAVEYIDARDSTDTEAIAGSIRALANAVAFIPPAELIGGPVLVCLADVEPVAIDWLWPKKLPLGRITLLAGRPGGGKSIATCDMTARVTTGSPWPDGSDCPIGSVILITAEDDPGDTIRPRLDAHYADVRRVHLLTMVRRFDENGKPHEIMFTLENVAALETALKAHPDCKLVVIDPIGSFLGGSTDAHRDNEVRSVLAPVAKLAATHGFALLIVCHTRKATSNAADDLVMGSRAFTGIARVVLHLSRDPQNKARRLLLPGKNNLAPEGDGLAFTIAGDPPAVQWERDPVAMSADEALAVENAGGNVDESRPGPEPAARNAAMEWLADLLAAGEVEASKVQAEAKAAGMNYRTVQRAADALGVRRDKNKYHGGWQWRFPKPGTVEIEDDKSTGQIPKETENLSTCRLGKNTGENGDSTRQDTEGDKLIYPGTLGAIDDYEREERAAMAEPGM
jgi:putative DNA primase/helicase